MDHLVGSGGGRISMYIQKTYEAYAAAISY
jgi:hypothetical protein